MDDLSYAYDGNQLLRVKDVGNNDYGFREAVDLATEYTYDQNGNMISDLNKKITTISYNYPRSAKFATS